MYRSYTLNSYLNSLNKTQGKEEPKEPTNKSQNTSFTFPTSYGKGDGKADGKAEVKAEGKGQNASFTASTTAGSAVKNQAKIQETIREPIRYQKLSSIGSNSQTKAQVQPTKHQILTSGTAFKSSSDSKPQQPNPNPSTNTNSRQPITLSGSIKLTADINQSQSQQGQSQSHNQSQDTNKNQTLYNTPPTKVVNPQARNKPVDDFITKILSNDTRGTSVRRNQSIRSTEGQRVGETQPVGKVEPAPVQKPVQVQNPAQIQNQVPASVPTQATAPTVTTTSQQSQYYNQPQQNLTASTTLSQSQSKYQSQSQPQPQQQFQQQQPQHEQLTESQTYNYNEPHPAIQRKQSLKIYSQAEQNNLFSEFKIKYDELKMNYDKLRQQFDDQTREKKKMQIKLLNSNPEYYEKQIKRLRAEVQKYQEQNQDNKYKYLQAENGRKEFEASFKVKQQELKTLIKQLEKEKISNVELKYQNDEKERVFGRIKMEFQRSNDATLKNYDQAVTKVNKLDGALKTRNAEYEELKKNNDRTERRLNQLKDEYKKYKQITDEKVKNANKQIETKNFEYLKTKTELTSKIDQLLSQIQKYKSQRISTQLLKTRKTEELSIIKSNRQLELDIVRLEDRIRFLEYELVQKDQMIIELQRSIEKIKVQEEIRGLEERITGLSEEKAEILREGERVKCELLREIDQLKLALMQAPERVMQSGGNANFQQILRIQLQQNSKIKRELSQKIDEIYNLKSDIDQIKVQKSNLQSQMEVLRKIKKSEQKNIKLQAEIASQHVKNDIESYKRKIELLEVKLNMKTKQVKEKDTFIMNSVLGRCKAEETPLILADFQRIFEANYVEKLAEANQRIQDVLQQRK